MVESCDIPVIHLGQGSKSSTGSVERQDAVQNHMVVLWMIFRGKGAQVCKFHHNEVGRKDTEKSSRQTQFGRLIAKPG